MNAIVAFCGQILSLEREKSGDDLSFHHNFCEKMVKDQSSHVAKMEGLVTFFITNLEPKYGIPNTHPQSSRFWKNTPKTCSCIYICIYSGFHVIDCLHLHFLLRNSALHAQLSACELKAMRCRDAVVTVSAKPEF